jgi:hypothetical protein
VAPISSKILEMTRYQFVVGMVNLPINFREAARAIIAELDQNASERRRLA